MANDTHIKGLLHGQVWKKRGWPLGSQDGCFVQLEARGVRRVDLVLHVGAAVQGDPAAAVAWLANTLGRYGVALEAGDVILSGSLVPLEPAAAGDRFEMTLHGIGSCRADFS